MSTFEIEGDRQQGAERLHAPDVLTRIGNAAYVAVHFADIIGTARAVKDDQTTLDALRGGVSPRFIQAVEEHLDKHAA